MSWHRCTRFWEIGVYCPYQVLHPPAEASRRRRRDPDEDEPPEAEPFADSPVPVPPLVDNPFSVPVEEPVPPVFVEPPVDPPSREIPLPIPVLPGPYVLPLPRPPVIPAPEEEPEQVPQPVGVGAAQGGSPFPYLLPDNLKEALKNYIADRARRGINPERVEIPVAPPPRTQEAAAPALVRLAAGIEQMQSVNEGGYAVALAELAEQKFVAGVQEQIAKNEKSAGSQFFEEIGPLGAALVAAVATTVGFHMLRKVVGTGGSPAGIGFVFKAPTFRPELLKAPMPDVCSYCASIGEQPTTE